MCSVDRLVQRLSAEVASADERVHALQVGANTVFRLKEQRVKRFAAMAERVLASLQLRIETLMKYLAFNHVPKLMRLDRHGGERRTLESVDVTVEVPYSDECPAMVELAFRVGADSTVENAFIEYALRIVPVYIEFESHARLLVSIDSPGDEEIAVWIEDRLVEFTRTYLAMFFNEQYQRQSLEMDPVMNISFPRAFAAEKRQFRERTFYFYTHESSDEFEVDPGNYVGTEERSAEQSANARPAEEPGQDK